MRVFVPPPTVFHARRAPMLTVLFCRLLRAVSSLPPNTHPPTHPAWFCPPPQTHRGAIQEVPTKNAAGKSYSVTGIIEQVIRPACFDGQGGGRGAGLWW